MGKRDLIPADENVGSLDGSGGAGSIPEVRYPDRLSDSFRTLKALEALVPLRPRVGPLEALVSLYAGTDGALKALRALQTL